MEERCIECWRNRVTERWRKWRNGGMEQDDLSIIISLYSIIIKESHTKIVTLKYLWLLILFWNVIKSDKLINSSVLQEEETFYYDLNWMKSKTSSFTFMLCFFFAIKTNRKGSLFATGCKLNVNVLYYVTMKWHNYI